MRRGSFDKALKMLLWVGFLILIEALGLRREFDAEKRTHR
jgi:hypothetical protein